MNAARAYALAVALALTAAEAVRPTTIPPKRLSHPSLVRGAGLLPLTQEQLEDLPPIDRLAVGNIDGVRARGGGPPRLLVSGGRLGEREVLEMTGWCGDPDARAPGAGLLLVVDGTRRIDVSDAYGAARADVARFYRTPSLTNVGFDVRIGADRIGAGAHGLQIAVVARDGEGIFLFPTIVRLSISPQNKGEMKISVAPGFHDGRGQGRLNRPHKTVLRAHVPSS